MIINDLDDYYIVFDTKNRNTELDTLFVYFYLLIFYMLGTVFQKSKTPSYVLFSLTFSKNTNIISLTFSKKQ